MPTQIEVLNLVRSAPGLRGRELAARLGAPIPAVNSILWSLRVQGLTRQDRQYRWHPADPGAGGVPSGAPASGAGDTRLGRICRYYLECLSLDDETGVRLFARSQFALDYVELPELAGLQSEAPLTTFPGVDDFFRRLRSDKERKVPYLGYPVMLKHVRSAKWEGFMLLPVFLFSFGEEAFRAGHTPSLEAGAPILNSAVIKALAFGNEHFAMAEAARLADELGLGDPDTPEFDEIVERLTRIRAEWPWVEPIDPQELAVGERLDHLEREGLHNRCILFGHERSAFTRGLELELSRLRDLPAGDYQNSILASWLDRSRPATSHGQGPPPTLIETLPLNSEQREAVQRALTAPLTVITGPPGTGKSQVVSSILINAARLGKRVLFASKNNKAVDVVESRVNELGPRPVLLRLGRGEHQSVLRDYLTTLLGSRATNENRAEMAEAEQEFGSALARIQALEDLAQRTVDLRNQVDTLERRLEPVRGSLDNTAFQSFRSLEPERFEHPIEEIRSTIDAAFRGWQPPWVRWTWFLHRGRRFRNLHDAIERHTPALRELALELPEPPGCNDDLERWKRTLSVARERTNAIRPIRDYAESLARLTSAPRLEDIWAQLSTEKTRIADESLRLWRAWLRLAPDRLSTRDRELLGEFAALLRLLADADDDGRHAGSHVFGQYHRLFPSLVSLLSCWAITSLSVRGRIPLEPAFFDLVVIDEASQCDIASAIPLLFRAKAAVIIGDPQQLRHISGIPARRDRELLQKHAMTDGHVKWAYSENSLFDLATVMAGPEDLILLRDHHRSHADIIGFSNQHFYEGRLRVATRHDRLRRAAPDAPALRWIPVEGRVVTPGAGAVNEIEARAVMTEIERLALHQGYAGSVGVVTPFRAQANRIRDLVNAHPEAGRLLGQLDLLVDTVHRFQGDERDVILFSPVVSRGVADGAIGFLRKTGNLFNVAITRAKAALIVVGDPNAARECGVGYLSEFVDYVERIRIQSGQSNRDQPGAYGGPDYPPVQNPEQVSDWERLFYRHLWQAGLRPVPQYREEKFILDLALFDGPRKLDIEIDGERYHRDWNGELLRRDQLRNMRLIELGWDVMRFWVYQIRDDLPSCLKRVKSWVERTTV